MQAVRGMKLIRVFALIQALPQSFNLLFIIPVILFWSAKEAPIYVVLFGLSITGILGWMFMEHAFQKRMKTTDKIKQISGKTILNISLPMLVTDTMVFIIGETGIIILGMFRSASEVGYYCIAVKLASLATVILQAVNAMIGPKFSELFHSNKIEDLFHVAKKSSKLIFILTAPIVVGLLVLGKQILIVAFGKEYAIVYPALVILLFGQFVNSISGATGLFMNMTGNQNVLKNIMIMSAGINIIINLALSPYYGIIGASLASMSSIIFWNITTLIYLNKKFKIFIGYLPNFNL